MVRDKLPNTEITGRSESCGKEKYQFCDFICDTGTFTTKAYGETFKIQLNCNSQKVVYLLKGRICGESPYFGKAKTKLEQHLIIAKVLAGLNEKKRKLSQQRYHERYGQHCHNEIDD